MEYFRIEGSKIKEIAVYFGANASDVSKRIEMCVVIAPKRPRREFSISGRPSGTTHEEPEQTR